MLITTQLALAQLDDAAGDIRIARQLFPEDIDFVLMDCLCKSASNDLDGALETLTDAGLQTDIVEQWSELCVQMNLLTSDAVIDSGLGELDVVRLQSILEGISTRFIPVLQQRGWRLPSVIESKLSRLIRELPVALASHDQSGIAKVEEITKIHPEASLFTILGGLLLLRCDANPAHRDAEIPQLEQARTAYREALTRLGFMKRNNQMAWKAIFTISTILAHSMQHEVESNFRQVLEAASMVETDSIQVPSQIRTFVILTLDRGDLDQASRWIDRWIQMSSTGDVNWQHAIWHKAVLCKRREQWLDVRTNCELLLNANPNYPEAEPLRNFAIGQIRSLLNETNEETSE